MLMLFQFPCAREFLISVLIRELAGDHYLLLYIFLSKNGIYG